MATTITLSKALKVKCRIIEILNKIQRNVSTYNSYPAENKRPLDV